MPTTCAAECSGKPPSWLSVSLPFIHSAAPRVSCHAKRAQVGHAQARAGTRRHEWDER